MGKKLTLLAIAAALTAGTSSIALAQYACPPGYALYGGVCQPAPAGYAPNNPLSGAAAGAAAGTAQGQAVGGPIGGIVGGAIGTATGTIAGTANAVAGAPVAPVAPVTPACGPGYAYYSGACYPAR